MASSVVLSPSVVIEPVPLREFLDAVVGLPPYPFSDGPLSAEALRVSDLFSFSDRLERANRGNRVSREMLSTFFETVKARGRTMGDACTRFTEAVAILRQTGFPMNRDVLRWSVLAREQSILLTSNGSMALALVRGEHPICDIQSLTGLRDGLVDLALVPAELRAAARDAIRDGHLRNEGLGPIFQRYLRNVGERIPRLGLPVLVAMTAGAFLAFGGEKKIA